MGAIGSLATTDHCQTFTDSGLVAPQSDGLAVLGLILARKKQSEKQRYLDAWDLESCQVRAGVVALFVFLLLQFFNIPVQLGRL